LPRPHRPHSDGRESLDAKKARFASHRRHGTQRVGLFAYFIHATENGGQRRNDLSIILICFGHVLRRTKALKKVVFRNYFSVGWIIELLVPC
jgi:hypothetical protein